MFSWSCRCVTVSFNDSIVWSLFSSAFIQVSKLSMRELHFSMPSDSDFSDNITSAMSKRRRRSSLEIDVLSSSVSSRSGEPIAGRFCARDIPVTFKPSCGVGARGGVSELCVLGTLIRHAGQLQSISFDGLFDATFTQSR